jgi:rhomboid protease GluP
LRGSTLCFVGYNLIAGAMDHRIDSAAHLGGLASGFVAGLLIGRPWPISPGATAVVRRAVLGGVAALGLFVAYRGVRAKIQGDPALARISEAGERADMKLKSFLDQARSEMEDYDRILHETDRIIDQLKQPNPPPPALAPDEATLVTKLADLAARAEADRDRLDRIPVAGQDLSTMRRSLSRAFESLSQSLHALRRVIETDDASYLNGPEGFTEHRRSSNEHLNSYGSALQEYARKHHLNLSPR